MDQHILCQLRNYNVGDTEQESKWCLWQQFLGKYRIGRTVSQGYKWTIGTLNAIRGSTAKLNPRIQLSNPRRVHEWLDHQWSRGHQWFPDNLRILRGAEGPLMGVRRYQGARTLHFLTPFNHHSPWPCDRALEKGKHPDSLNALGTVSEWGLISGHLSCHHSPGVRARAH